MVDVSALEGAEDTNVLSVIKDGWTEEGRRELLMKDS